VIRRLLLLVCVCSVLFAKLPRPVASVPILTQEGKNIDLKKFRGRTIALVIFSTTCEECLQTLQIMNKLQQDLGPQGLQVVAAAGDLNGRYLIGPFVARYRPPYPVGYIDKDAIIKLADVPQGVRPMAPIILFIDRWGMVRQQFYGNDTIFKDAGKSLRYMCQGAMKMPPVGTPPAGR
jgi:hypothetical protein